MSAELSAKEKAVLCGLYLSKFDLEGLKRAGFASFNEAYRIWGEELRIKPKTIKNHRDYFDPHFSNPRRGWWQVPLPPAQKIIYNQFKDYDIEKLLSVIVGFAGSHAATD